MRLIGRQPAIISDSRRVSFGWQDLQRSCGKLLSPTRCELQTMKVSERVRWILLVAAMLAVARPTIAALQCVEYGAASLAGRLVRQTYPGPPDYESVTKGDEPRIIWVLVLDQRTCAYSSSTYTSRYGEREVQLVLDAEQYLQYSKFLGKQLVVTGELIRGAAKYEKRLVLIVSEMKETRSLRGTHLYSPHCRC
jgi:Domain of unknown function (DUF4431)